jgi:RNA polymerase sigma-70 factor (ECF subfamily)
VLRCAPEPVENSNIDDFGAHLEAARHRAAPSCQWLYESLAGRVCGYLRVHGAAEPDDLTNEVFLRVFTNLDRFEGDETGFRSWVFTIAHRVLIDEHRRQRRRPQTVELSSPLVATVAGGNAEREACDALADTNVAVVLASLPEDQRDVLTLRIVADLPIERVAALLGKRPGAIKSLQHRAIRNLRRMLADAGELDMGVDRPLEETVR